MNRMPKVTAETLSASIGRPVRMFTSVCRQSQSFNEDLLRESADIIKYHQGSVVIAVHPGFYYHDEDRSRIIANAQTPQEISVLDGQYRAYRKGLEQFLSERSLPLLLFIEENRGLMPYEWLFKYIGSDLTLVVETTRQTFLPLIRDDAPSESLLWVWAASAIRADLGIRKAEIFGEYYFVNGGIPSGCVHSVFLALERHILRNVNTALVFPNSPRKLDAGTLPDE